MTITPQIWGLCMMCAAAGLIFGTVTSLEREARVAGWILLAVGAVAFYGSAFYGGG